MDSPISAQSALLQALIEGKSYGLELIDRVKTKTKGGLVLHQGSVYPALRELENDGLVTSHEADPTPERGGRPRRYYELTAEGLRAAKEDKKVVEALFGVPVPT
jgi:PadR family transcriptional regulator, regulatory protein PadR